MRYPVSVQLHSLRNELQAGRHADVIARLARVGFAAVEPAGLHGWSPEDFRRLVDDHGLRVSSLHTAFPDEANAGGIAATAHTLGCAFVISGLGPDAYTTAALPMTASRVARAQELMRAAGLSFALHNHHWELHGKDGATPYDQLLALDPEALFQIDIYWAADFGANDPSAVVRKYRARTPLLHIKDGTLVAGEPHLPAGFGRMDIPAAVRAADPAVLRWLVCELDSCATDMMQALADSLRYLERSGLGIGRGAD